MAKTKAIRDAEWVVDQAFIIILAAVKAYDEAVAAKDVPTAVEALGVRLQGWRLVHEAQTRIDQARRLATQARLAMGGKSAIDRKSKADGPKG